MSYRRVSPGRNSYMKKYREQKRNRALNISVPLFHLRVISHMSRSFRHHCKGQA